jgi:hypothetical protein
MPRVWFEPTIPALKRAKAVHVSDHETIAMASWRHMGSEVADDARPSRPIEIATEAADKAMGLVYQS